MFVTPSQIKMWYACVNNCKQPIWRPIVHRIYHKDSIFGLYTEYRYRNNAQMAHTGRYGGSGRWQALLKMAITMANADNLTFFLWNELEPRCQQRAAGSLELVGPHIRVWGSVGLIDKDSYIFQHFLCQIVFVPHGMSLMLIKMS